MVMLRNKKNYLLIISSTPSYLELWKNYNPSELQLKGGIEDNSTIIFLISQKIKHVVTPTLEPPR